MKCKEIVSNEQKNFKQNKATDGIDVEFSRELADHNDLEANARANAADARQKRQSTEK
ncbi:YfhD family protein [Bacillus thuringiensis serovar canadensis]|nr:YfhD family protein [Bacillus thuringiensis serovar canadensis]PFR15128.1 YfhD family protein [Bacillus anthracis]